MTLPQSLKRSASPATDAKHIFKKSLMEILVLSSGSWEKRDKALSGDFWRFIAYLTAYKLCCSVICNSLQSEKGLFFSYAPTTND